MIGLAKVNTKNNYDRKLNKPNLTSVPSNDGLPRVDKLSQLHIDEDGTVHKPEMAVPVSPYLSPERKILADRALASEPITRTTEAGR
jgi:hypothetical protein